MTEQEEKEQALKNIKDTAVKAAQDAMPGLLEKGLTSDEIKAKLTDIVNESLKSATYTDSVDGKQKTVEELVTELQKQHDMLAKYVKDHGANAQVKGAYIEFLEKNMDSNPNMVDSPQYASKTQFKAAALMTTANVIPNVAGGFSPLFGNYIDTEIGSVPKPANVILPLITVKNQPGTESIWYSDRINEEGDAQFIGEGDLKPLIDAEWVTSKAPVKEVAERWKFTNRLLRHAPSVVADFEEHARELIDQKVDLGVLTGDNTGNNLLGVQTAAAAFVVPTQLAGYYADANIWDVVNAMAARIRLSNFNGQITAVLNTVWETMMMGIKDADGRYITPPFVSPDGRKIGSVNVVFSNKIPDTAILIGDLKQFNLVWAEQVIYAEGYENDDFSRNLVSRKLEAFMGTYIKRSAAGSILYDDIASVLTDISAV